MLDTYLFRRQNFGVLISANKYEEFEYSKRSRWRQDDMVCYKLHKVGRQYKLQRDYKTRTNPCVTIADKVLLRIVVQFYGHLWYALRA